MLGRRQRQISECSGQSGGSITELAQRSLAQKFFETRQKVSTKFKSGHINVSYSSQFLINIDWHPWHQNKNAADSWKSNRLDFAEIIKKSIWSEMHTKSWCDEAGSYQNGNQTRQPLNLPEILGNVYHTLDNTTFVSNNKLPLKVLNCHLESPRDEELWRIQTSLAENENSSFIPFEMKFRIYKKGNIEIIKSDSKTDNNGKNESDYEDYNYNLHGTVIFIQEPGNPIGNLVSHIRNWLDYHLTSSISFNCIKYDILPFEG